MVKSIVGKYANFRRNQFSGTKDNKTMRKYLLLSLAAIVGAALQAAPDLGIASYNKDAPVDVQADSFQSLANGWVSASGNVIIRQSDAQVTADRVRINRETGEVVAEGNVVLIREGQVATHSDRISYNFKTGEGLAPNLDVQSEQFRVISGPSKRDAYGFFHLEDGLITTCTNDPSCLHYAVTARTGEFKPGEYVRLHNAVVRFMDTPVFWYPNFRRSLVDHFGWRFQPGYESDWGAYLLSTYKMQLFDLGGETHDSINSYTHGDYRTERGWAAGEDVTWKLGELYQHGTYGYVSGYYLSDDDPMNEDYDRFQDRDVAEDSRYRVKLRNDTYLTPADYLTLRTTYYSDSYVMQDFFEDEYKDYIIPESYASYTHNGLYTSYGATVNHRVNKFYQNVNRTPELWLDSNLIELGESGIYYQTANSGAFLEYEYADYDTTNRVPASYDTLRVDTKHQFDMPLKVDFVSLVPRVSWRGTYYSETRSSHKQPYVTAAGTNGVKTVWTEEGADMRSLFEIGAEASFKAYGFYDGASNTVYRHVVEPYADWSLIPEPNLRPKDLYHFDAIDNLDKGHSVRLGVRQLVQRKNADGAISKILDLDLYGIYYFEDQNDESGMKYYGADCVWYVTDDIKIDTDARYNAFDDEFEHIDFWMSLWQGDRWEVAGECYYIPDDTTLLRGDIRCNLSQSWAVGLYTRYDAEESRCEQISGYMQYSLDCISFRFRSAYEPSYTRDDGTEREAKLKFSFNAWLRAFTPSRYERRLHDGYWDD